MKWKLLITILLLSLLCLVSANAQNNSNANTSALNLLQNAGVSVLNSPVVDFTLPDANSGQERMLSQYKGKWIFLVFWATWCGPCQAELPMLEGLYQETKKDGLVVLGVSIDRQDVTSVRSFLKSKGITFPVVHDDSNSVASKYQANSVPTIYVISPDWLVVGIVRGAKEWDNTNSISMVRELLKIKEMQSILPARPAANSSVATTDQINTEKVELPNNLVPPKMQVRMDAEQIVEGREFFMDIAVSWEGEAWHYAIKVPKITVPEGVIVGSPASYSSTAAKSAELRYRFPLTIAKEGRYSLGPVELGYRPVEGGQELFSRISAVEIEVVPGFWKRNFITIMSGFGCTLLILIGVALWVRRKNDFKKRKLAEQVPSDPYRERKEQISMMKIKASRTEYERALVKFCLEVESVEIEKKRLQELLDGISYGGRQLSDAQLVYYEKKLS